LGVKQTWHLAAKMSAFDPKQTLLPLSAEPLDPYDVLFRASGEAQGIKPYLRRHVIVYRLYKLRVLDY
jgi:hypothetical protein